QGSVAHASIASSRSCSQGTSDVRTWHPRVLSSSVYRRAVEKSIGHTSHPRTGAKGSAASRLSASGMQLKKRNRNGPYLRRLPFTSCHHSTRGRRPCHAIRVDDPSTWKSNEDINRRGEVVHVSHSSPGGRRGRQIKGCCAWAERLPLLCQLSLRVIASKMESVIPEVSEGKDG
ncbi:hypothetical protein NDU88_002995, partial [Pleurodeles waltl]